MRKSRLEASKTRNDILRAASVEFRRRGIGEVSLGELMGAAGLTHGGFYRHFGSKDQVVGEACALAVEEFGRTVREAVAESAGAESGVGVLEVVAAKYLSTEHRDNPGAGCAFAALGSELAHGSEETRRVAMEGFSRLVDLLAGQFSGLSAEEARSRALACASTLVGALTVARVVPDVELSELVLESARVQLMAMRGQS